MLREKRNLVRLGASWWDTHQVFVSIYVNGTDDCERLFGFMIERPRFLHFSFEPIANAAVFPFKRRRYSSNCC